MKYDTLEEAQSRLKGTLIYLNDVPIYVRDITDTGAGPYRRGQENRFHLHYYEVEAERRGGATPLSNEGLRQNNFKLGYCNVPYEEDKSRTVYMTRIPTRRTKQGICAENLMLVPTERELGNVRFSDIQLSVCVGAMLKGNYPTIEKAYEAVNNGSFSSSFHRHFALAHDDFRGDTILMHRGHKIGFGDPDLMVLSPQYQFCREAALEAGIKRIR